MWRKLCRFLCLYTLGGLFGAMVVIYPAFMADVWVPYLTRDWRHASCTVISTTTYKMTFDYEWNSYTEYYTRMNVLVNVSNTLVPAFACGASGNRIGLTAKSPTGMYPGYYVTCPLADVCGKELLLSPWTCSDCVDCDQFLTGKPTPCMWSEYRGDNYHGSSRSSEKDGVGTYRVPFPTSGTAFLQVVLGEEVAYPLGDLIGLQIAGFFGLLVVPTYLAISNLKTVYQIRQSRRALLIIPQNT